MKRNYLKLTFFTTLLVTLIITSCKKDTPPDEYPNTIKSLNSDWNIRYFSDFLEVDSGDIDLNDTTKIWFVKVEALDTTDGADTLSYYAFTTIQNYYDFGAQNGIDLEMFDNWVDGINTEVLNNGWGEDIDNGIIPEGYEELIEDYIRNNGGEYLFEKNFGPTSGFWSKSCGGVTITSTAYKTFYPIINLGWNNDISSFYPIKPYNCNILYDNYGWKNRIATYWGWGWRSVPLCDTWADKRASSWLRAL